MAVLLNMGRNFKKNNKGITFKPQGSTPTNPTDGDIYYDNVTGKFKFRETGVWNEIGVSSSGGVTNPMTTLGDMILGDSSGNPIRLGIGYEGAVLTVSSGAPTWVGGTPPPTSSGRALYATGGSSQISIDYFTIATAGNAQNFGNVAIGRSYCGGYGGNTRGLIIGGNGDTSGSESLMMATLGNSTSWASLLSGVSELACAGNSTYCMISYSTSVQYLLYATNATASSFGASFYNGIDYAGTSSPTRAVFSARYSGAPNVMDYLDFATSGTVSSFGTMTQSYGGGGEISNGTRGIFFGGWIGGSINTIQYITFATLGAAQNFGTMTLARAYPRGASSATRGLLMGGVTFVNTDSVEIATTGNSTSFGNLITARYYGASMTDSHGGLT
jgi:hypothetical protein